MNCLLMISSLFVIVARTVTKQQQKFFSLFTRDTEIYDSKKNYNIKLYLIDFFCCSFVALLFCLFLIFIFRINSINLEHWNSLTCFNQSTVFG